MRWVRKTRLDPNQIQGVERELLRRIVGCVRPYWQRSTGVVVCMVLGAVFNLAPPWFIKQVIDVAIPQHDVRWLWICCAGIIAGPLAAGLLQVAQKYGAERIGQDVMFDLRLQLYRHLHRMPFTFFTNQKPGEVVTHVLNDVQGVGSAVSGTLVDVTQNTIVLLSTTAFLVLLDWRLALLAVALLPLFVTPARRVGRIRKGLKRRVQAGVGELTGMLTETLSVSGALLVQLFGGEEREVRRFRDKAEEIKRLTLEQSLVGRWFQLLLGSFEAVAPAVVFACGGLLVMNGRLALGTIVAFTALLKRLYSPASQLAGVHVDLLTSYAYFDRVFSMLDLAPGIQDTRGSISRRVTHGCIEFKGVSFAYSDEAHVLKDIDLVVPAGATLGIVGPSGAGKSTMASLLMRLYDAGSGSVTVDGVDVRRLTLASLRESMAVVTQDTFLFNTTVMENLRYGNPSATRADVEDAARRAQIHHVIADLPEGYETLVGERGYRFSAGERQRLAIARAILRDPRILILDEATSSLDSVAERQVQQAIAPLLAGRTSLIIAHRLTTIRDADLIIVVDHGRIVERGTHEELLARAGLYAWLWHAQARSDRDGAAQEFAGEPAYVGAARASVRVRGGRQTDRTERERGW